MAVALVLDDAGAERAVDLDRLDSGSGVGADELVRNADVAMYVSKHGGKGRLSHYEAA